MSVSTPRRRAVAALVALTMALWLAPATAAAGPSAPLPARMAAVGDSITQAASSAGSLGADAPQNSWSTGTSTTVNSHYLRLLAAGAPISGQSYNRSVSGAKMVDLNAQMASVVALQPDYVTVLIGGNDLCTDTVAQMTDPAVFRAQFDQAMSTLTTGSPGTRVFVASVPNVYQLWDLFKGDFWARFVWSVGDICQSLLANPTSTQAADVQRREAVRQRNIAFNQQLADVCASHPSCLFDGNAVFNTPFARGDVSGDYFHPSIAGQAKLAAVTWGAGYTWTATPPANNGPTAAFTSSCTDLACSFIDGSTDDLGIMGRTWTFGDGATSTETNPSHTYATAGSYTVTLSVTDGGGLSDTKTANVTVTAPPAPTIMTLASLTGSAQSTGKNTWAATGVATVTSGGAGVDGATVTVSWGSGSRTCVTVAGSCSVITDNLTTRKVAQVTLTVTQVTHPTLTWDGEPVSTIVRRP